jgi:hypothetical protein
MPEEEKLYFNGIDGDTGKYLVPPMTYGQAVSYLTGEPQDTALIRYLKTIWKVLTKPHLGLPDDIKPEDLTKAGWAVVFHKDEDPEVKKALDPLVQHRKDQIGDDTRVKVLEYDGVEDAHGWLASQGVMAGSVEPWKVPFYLLLVGSPERIPLSFGNLLEVEYAVGRLHFDNPSDYKQYVQSLVNYEEGQAPPRAKEAVFFGTRHKFDKATQLSADHLVNPLADGLPAEGGRPAQGPVAKDQGFSTRKIWGEAATKAALSDVLAPPHGAQGPAFLFTASHGVGYTKPRPEMRETYGALVCQDWPAVGEFEPQHRFAAGDIDSLSTGLQVHGLIAFLFACFGAGTPSHDRFVHKRGEPPRQIADKAFLAALPKALLSHPQGGALACIGHVERAWGYSLTTIETGPVVQPFRNAVQRILAGKPVGLALKDFRERYASFNSRLSEKVEKVLFSPELTDEALLQERDKDLASDWAFRNDAEGYVVLGDPAVKLRVADLVS